MRRVQLLQQCVAMVLFLGIMTFQVSAQQADQAGKRLEVFEVEPSLQKHIWEVLHSEFKTFQMGANSVAVIETPERLQRAREMVQLLNKIEAGKVGNTQASLIVSVVVASLDAAFAEGTALPENLRPVVNELKTMFPYQSYRLLDAMPVRVALSADERNVRGVAYQGSSTLGPCTIVADARCIQSISIAYAISGEPIKLSNFSYSLRVPRPQKRVVATKDGKEEGIVYDQLAFSTSVDIVKGQTMVVGKLNPDSAQTAYFITVTRLRD